jgi:sugar/nucleoside kinase (ribokinase family)
VVRVTGAPVGLFAGLATLDVVYRVPRPPGPDEKVQALRQDLAAGGPAANAAVTFAALGGRPVLLTALGTHPLARLIADELTDRGVTVLDAAPDRADPPAVSSVVVTEHTAQRSVVSMRGLGVVIPGVPTLPTADVVLLDGHHPALAVAAAKHGSATGVPVLLDAGSWKDVLPKVLPHTDIAACSAAFRTPAADSGPPDAIASDLLADAGTVLITRGGEPVLWWQDGLRGEVPAVPVTAVDTLAAGDVFHGALAFAAARTHAHADPEALQQAIAFACRVAALRCRIAGPRAWLADPELAELAGWSPA